MSSWNMPPGVTTNMIPGNRPEDLAEEEFWDKLTGKLMEELKMEELEDFDPFTEKAIEIARDLGYQRGFNEGSADAEASYGALHGAIYEELQAWEEANPGASWVSHQHQYAKIKARLMGIEQDED